MLDGGKKLGIFRRPPYLCTIIKNNTMKIGQKVLVNKKFEGELIAFSNDFAQPLWTVKMEDGALIPCFETQLENIVPKYQQYADIVDSLRPKIVAEILACQCFQMNLHDHADDIWQMPQSFGLPNNKPTNFYCVGFTSNQLAWLNDETHEIVFSGLDNENIDTLVAILKAFQTYVPAFLFEQMDELLAEGENPDATALWDTFTNATKEAFHAYFYDCCTDFSNWSNYENGVPPTEIDCRVGLLNLIELGRNPYFGEGRKTLIVSDENQNQIWVNWDEFLNLRDSSTVFEKKGVWEYHEDEADEVYQQIGGKQHQNWLEDWRSK